MTGPTSNVHTPVALPRIDETLDATTRYLDALTVLDEESAQRPSVLPGWTRAHVVSHVSRNADAFVRVLQQAAEGDAAWMYADQETRDHDIEESATGHDVAGLVEDARRSAARLEQSLRGNTADPGTPYARRAGDDPTFELHTVGPRRWAEVVIHHSDLDIGYSPADWPPEFSLGMVKQRQDELAALAAGGPSFVLSSTDVAGLWKFGEGQGMEIHGTVGELAWWLVGRGGGQGLTSSTGELPTLGRWR